MPPNTFEEWNERYLAGELPWDSGIRSRELARVIDDGEIPLGRALELGCGTGTNSVYLASKGFQVTAVDCAPAALEFGKAKAAEAGVDVIFLAGDVCELQPEGGSFDFIFDRGCYHCIRRTDLVPGKPDQPPGTRVNLPE